ncbi:hypothetical protein LZ30DRAFT_774375 [Colletotrichum cereale]|nr:hypothetical protein LZ30DRAFT_774375 [Colletotrichum cereale]
MGRIRSRVHPCNPRHRHCRPLKKRKVTRGGGLRSRLRLGQGCTLAWQAAVVVSIRMASKVGARVTSPMSTCVRPRIQQPMGWARYLNWIKLDSGGGRNQICGGGIEWTPVHQPTSASM